MSLGLEDLNVRYVYRVLRPDEDPNEDIACKAPHSNRSISEHIATGLRTPSKFISTTSSLESAHKWLQTSDERTSSRYGNRRTTIVRIDVGLLKQRYPRIADSAVDLTTHYNRNVFLEDERQMRFAGAYKEVLFVGRIPSEAVNIEYKRGQRIVPNESSAHVPSLYNPVISINQLGTQYDSEDETLAASPLRENRLLGSFPNIMYASSNYNETRNSASNYAQIKTTQPASLYSSNTTSLPQTRNAQASARSNPMSNKVASPYTTHYLTAETTPRVLNNNQFSPHYYGANSSFVAASLREKPRFDSNSYSMYDYSNYGSASNYLSRFPNNPASLQQSQRVHSGAGSYQRSNKAQSPYTNMTDSLTARHTPCQTAKFESNSFSSRYPIRDEAPPINRSLPTRDNSAANTSIWRKILSFFKLV